MAGRKVLPGSPTQQGYLGLALVVGTGLSTSIFALSHASETTFGAHEAPYVFTPVVVSIALVVTGVLLWANSFDGPEMLRIGGGVFVGMAVFGLLVTWTVTHEFIRGGSVAYAPFVTVNSMSIGGFAGLILGWLNARNRRYEAKLERERNKLKQQTEDLDEFAGIVSHDLRNPLNVATLELGNAKVTADEDTRETLTEVETSLARMEQIIEDVLAMARDGQTIEERERVALSAVAEHAWRNVQTGTATLEVVDSKTVRADRGALEHIFENLFRNSVEHGSTRPDSHARQDDMEYGSRNPASQAQQDAIDRETPRTQPDSAHAEKPVIEDGGDDGLTVRVGTLDGGFYIEDDGKGIPETVKRRLFESGVTTRDQGTGFGLSIVEKLVTAHGWAVRATDSAEGGARFEITGVEGVDGSEDSWLAEL
jgi:signal transduction histidine kinase